MMTFLEYSHNLEQISDMFKKMSEDKNAQVGAQLQDILITVPVDYIDKLSDVARSHAAIVFRRILLGKSSAWNKVGRFVRLLWDQPISGPGKTLGQDLMNWISAKVMEDTNSESFVSYSGNLSKGSVYHYTKKQCRVFPSKSNYSWLDHDNILKLIRGDYTAHSVNYKAKQVMN
jgi:hypothetical protein